MPEQVRRKDHPLSLRLPEDDLALIDRAAGLKGRSRTDFMREAAVRAAEDVLVESGLVRLSPADFEAFMATLSAPGLPVPALVELLERPAPWETGSNER